VHRLDALSAGSDSPLTEARRRAMKALQDLVNGDAEKAARALLLPPAVAADALAINAASGDSPTTPALRRYAGVVYDGLGFAELSPAEQRLAGRSVLIFSGLFGVVRGDEPVPAYRVPAKATLPGIGIASTFWRPVLTDVLADRLRRGLIIDLRSSDYAVMWRPDAQTQTRVVTVRVLSPAPRGGYAVISFNSKLAKGRLAAQLIRRHAAGEAVRGVDDVIAAWHECDGAARAELGERGRLDLFTT
jgi:cytoplasmic iron level regulating protein YaaA (DUF328/UPF0246 family)